MLGRSAVTETQLTVCGIAREALPAKFVSPLNVAVIVRGVPGVVKVREHPPAATAAEQDSDPSVVMVTVPVGVPAPGALGTTVHVTETGVDGVDGSGE